MQFEKINGYSYTHRRGVAVGEAVASLLSAGWHGPEALEIAAAVLQQYKSGCEGEQLAAWNALREAIEHMIQYEAEQ